MASRAQPFKVRADNGLMIKLRLFAMLALVCSGGACTKTNPALCCTDDANCASLGISTDHMCTDGLVCIADQCVAEACASSADCNAQLPFCSDQLCEATCENNAQCPGFGGSADNTICSNGACVQCLANTDCGGATPVCDTSSASCVQCIQNSDCPATAPLCGANVCHACIADSDCSSGACGDNGSCIDASALAYVAPGGTDAGTCTQMAPCATITFASGKDGFSRVSIQM